MNVASLENCKRLYELSGWWDHKLPHWYRQENGQYTLIHSNGKPRTEDGKLTNLTAYDCGYLLRKLPVGIPTGEYFSLLIDDFNDTREYSAGYLAYGDTNGSPYERADTPENALCLLAIKLFEEGVLKK